MQYKHIKLGIAVVYSRASPYHQVGVSQFSDGSGVQFKLPIPQMI